MIEIERYSRKGYGVGAFNGSSLDVKGALKGECVEVQRDKRRKGNLLQVVKACKERTLPKCMHSLECGGCVWQELEYSQQLIEKQKILENAFSSFQIKALPILETSSIWGYRNKMEFSFSQDKEGKKFLGLILAGSKGRVFELQECFLPSPWFAQTLIEMRAWWHESGLDAYRPFKNTGSLRTVTLRETLHTKERMVFLTVSGNPDYALNPSQLETFKALFKDQEVSVFLRIQQVQKGETTSFYEMLLKGKDHLIETLKIFDHELTCKISPTAFFQPNTLQAEKLYQAAYEMVQSSFEGRFKTILDLYSGTGTLGMVFSKLALKVVAIEINPYAVFDARENIKRNGIENMEILEGDVEIVLSTLELSPDVVLLDPPRVGLSKKTIEILLKLSPPLICYISCNPYTQAENVRTLVENGYCLKALQPVDLFPHTIHLENIALLEKREISP